MDRDALNEFITVLLKGIHEAYHAFLASELKVIIDQQERLVGGPRGYLHGYRAFLDQATVAPAGCVLRDCQPAPLHPSLYAQHLAWFEHYNHHQLNWQRICQGLTSILIRVKSRQELRDILPDYMLGKALQLPIVAGLPRKDADLYAARLSADPQPTPDAPWDDRILQLFRSVRPLVDTYLGYTFL